MGGATSSSPSLGETNLGFESVVKTIKGKDVMDASTLAIEEGATST
jgi:hypothetical protein